MIAQPVLSVWFFKKRTVEPSADRRVDLIKEIFPVTKRTKAGAGNRNRTNVLGNIIDNQLIIRYL
jgi:hypothetical protein